MRTILVVDDEPRIVKIARDYLERAGFHVLTAGDGRSVLTMARSAKPDLIVLDLALPEMDGLDVTRALRKESEIPIIMLTARDDVADRLIGLELGADDYIVKPFSPKELVARVRAVLRRWDGARAGTELVRAGHLLLDVPRMQASIDGRTVDLTPTEFQLLAAMARQPGRIFTRGQLLEAVHGVAVESYERAIDSHIKNIRRKIEPGDPGQAVLSVEDTGAGIPADDLPHIFDRFYKSKDSRGTGLGLAIVKSLVRAHGGEISAQSVSGEGTTIRFTLPLRSSP